MTAYAPGDLIRTICSAEAPMHATIHRYEGRIESPETLAGLTRGLASTLSEVPGFVVYLALEDDGKGFSALSVFEDAASRMAGDQIAECWLRDRLALPGQLSRVSGEVVAQRGL
ncbi:MAG TPA: hypothetical protein DEG70_06735 [Chloroflexi bacterium]|nr:hypothetical protein [Chloroflexota bacterium]